MLDVKEIENFRANLRTALEARDMTQEQLADTAGLKGPYVNRVLRGKTEPSLSQCARLARAAGFPLVALLTSPEDFSESVLTTAN
jgi:transcriptional regulator with XRE-family HTH domain